ncbi:hypothetical protein ACOMCU_16355 [Lysinibacillus sp. UGB7]|uniref:hypothetical protein n=1 Tax=Lysinibacillus sp. UGB7 TaxID=3411039 RepID=UPI003B80E2C8
MENKENLIFVNVFDKNFKMGLIGGQKDSVVPKLCIYCVACGEFTRGKESENDDGICFKCEKSFEEL